MTAQIHAHIVRSLGGGRQRAVLHYGRFDTFNPSDLASSDNLVPKTFSPRLHTVEDGLVIPTLYG